MSAADLLDPAVRVSCALCGDKLHRVVIEADDEWAWADEDGHHLGADADLRQLRGGDPWARIQFLSGELARAGRAPKAASRTWLYWHHAQEYSALTVRLRSGTFHEHRPDDLTVPGFRGIVPEHCNWPMRLRPSGWQCRLCGERQPA